MQTCFYLLIFLHIAEGCMLSDNTQVSITASSGESVALPCSCADPQDRAPNLIWEFRKKGIVSFYAIYPSDETNRYQGRVQLLTGDAPGNFTILISHLTAEDGGEYQCREKNQISNLRLVFLTVKAPLVLSTTTASTARPNGGSKTTESTPNPGSSVELTDKIPKSTQMVNDKINPHSGTPDKVKVLKWSVINHLYILVPVLLVMLLLFGGVCWTYRAQRRGQTRSKELRTEQRSEEGQHGNELLYSDVKFKPARKPPQKHSDDEDVVYASVKKRSDNEQDDVAYVTALYSTVKPRAQTTSQTAGDNTRTT
ncbi:uncharacterized protein LOC117596621 [Pangasianodon hypophthalmus]|uniref:uncharacterized protein LOC117596621 n=1 Tax=Pangasianodon hypophthalmus TaxID=310915 RepID=UPI002307844A|nr:uncharacterized protein LOC117596621 [Pangasianodon hypophthalmus]